MHPNQVTQVGDNYVCIEFGHHVVWMADACEFLHYCFAPELTEVVVQGEKKKSGSLGASYYYDNHRLLPATYNDELRAKYQVQRLGPPDRYSAYRFFVSPKDACIYVYDRRAPDSSCNPTMKFNTEEEAIAWMDWMLMLEIDNLDNKKSTTQ